MDNEPVTISPLAEASPESLDVLFERVNAKLIEGVPEALTDGEIAPLVDELKRMRIKFLADQDKLGRAPQAPRKRKPSSVADAIASTINPEDL